MLRTKLYLIRGEDSSSDNGYWEVIVSAMTIGGAKQRVTRFLEENGRSELRIDDVETLDYSKGIVHSTLQRLSK